MEDFWGGPLGGLAVAAVGGGMVVASRHYIQSSDRFGNESPSPERRDYWRAVARGERLGQPIAWGLTVVGLMVFVVRGLGA